MEQLEFAGGGYTRLYPAWLSDIEASAALIALYAEIPWQQQYIRIAGKQVAEPRLSSWHGDPDARYRYSGVDRVPLTWTPTLTQLRERLLTVLGVSFNSVLVNRYRDGRDAMGMHADDERELGKEPTIASLSLGMTRTLVLEPKKNRPGDKVRVPLTHGCLLVMGGPLQRDWKHGVPREAHVFEERINLTFRTIVGVP